MMNFGVWFWILFSFVYGVTAGYEFGSGQTNKGTADLITVLGCVLLGIARYISNRG